MTAVGFLGAGRMGAALVATLLKAGHAVHVWNRTAEKANSLATLGALPESTAEAAVAAADIVMVSLLDYIASDALFQRPEVTVALKGKLLVQLTSGSPMTARDTGLWATAEGIDYLDGAIMATPDFIGGANTLILYSGARRSYDKHKSVFTALGGKSAFAGEDFGVASALDSALLGQLWGTLFGTLQALTIARVEGIAPDDYAASLKLFQPVIDDAAADLISRVRDGRDRGDEATLATIAAHNTAFQHLRHIVAERGLSSAITDAFDSYFAATITNGHPDDDFAILARYMVSQ
ncbi:NAD(P)-dependent oxidoreductase [Brucella cytisi]|uniref:NAD(P)-dependent oxidoreductase n=1 Tax=Brucella cytisi TaxID=407152 RepID=UPI0035DF6C14